MADPIPLLQLLPGEVVAKALGDIEAVLQLGLLACGGDHDLTIASMIGAIVAIAGAAPDPEKVLLTAERALARARTRLTSAPAVPS